MNPKPPCPRCADTGVLPQVSEVRNGITYYWNPPCPCIEERERERGTTSAPPAKSSGDT